MTDAAIPLSGSVPAPDSPIDWRLAERIAVRVAGRTDFERTSAGLTMPAQFAELTAAAQSLVEDYTGLSSRKGPARAEVIDRPAWIRANLAGFRHLLDPLTERLAAAVADGGRAARVGRSVGRRLLGTELGMLLGFLAQRVLGQYDLLLPEEDDGGVVYYVGPNIAALERRFGFPSKDFRLWIALHEVTHRTQFTAVDWMRPYFLGLVDGMLATVDPDPRRLLEAVTEAVERLRQNRARARSGEAVDTGLVGLLATPEQRENLAHVQALMTLLEGHGNVVMDEIGAEHVQGQATMSETLRRRRRQGGLARLVFRLVGMEMKLRQYEEGEAFIKAVEARVGIKGVDAAWRSPEHLPTLEEIRGGADAWVTRVYPG